jgi:hypothetical protein
MEVMVIIIYQCEATFNSTWSNSFGRTPSVTTHHTTTCLAQKDKAMYIELQQGIFSSKLLENCHTIKGE